MRQRSRASQKARKRLFSAKGVLLITSMLDILTTILFFLLKNYSYVVTNFNVSQDLRLPESTTIVPPPDSTLNLVISKTAIMLDDVELIQIENGKIPRRELFRDGITIVKLAQALNEHKKRSKYVQSKNTSHTFSGMVVLQADKTLKYNLIKKVIYTAGITDFINLKLATLRKEM